MMLQYDFTGRAAVVTGAAGGMGKAVARGILTAGGAVAMIDVKPEPEDLGRFGGRVLYAQGDLTDESFVRRDQVFAINLKSMVHTSRAVVPHMRKAGGGAMVHFSTIQCLRGDPVPRMPIRRRRPASARCRARSPCRVLLDHGGA